MPAFSDYSATPNSNVTIAGLSCAENSTSLASVNNQLREAFANGRQLYDMVIALGTPVTVAGAAFTGNITRSGFGGYYCANDSSFTAPRIYSLVDGSSPPSSPPNGSLVIYYAP